MDILGLLEVPTWLLLATFVVLSLYIYYMVVFVNNYSRRLGQPGPQPYPVIGHLGGVFSKGFMEYDVYLVRKYGNLVGLSYGNHLETIVADPDVLREITTKQSHIFTDRRVMEQGTYNDNQLLNLKGARWKHVRSILSPTFSSGKLRQVAHWIQGSGKTFLDNLSKFHDQDKAFECKQIFGNFAIDVISATAFGIQVDSQTNPEDPIVKNFKALFDFNMRDPRIILFFLFPSWQKYLGWLGYGILKRSALNFFRDLTDKLVEERKTRQGDDKYKDFLQLVVDASRGDIDEQSNDVGKGEKGLTQNEIYGNSLLFFFAGFDTTSTALQYTAYHLAVYPEWQDKVVQEVDDVLKGDMPNHDNVQNLTVLDKVFSETLRIFPSVVRIDRVASEDVTIRGWFFPKGTIVQIPWYAIHHDPANFEDPEKFDPERFTAEAKQARNPYTYGPFGHGPRNCIGMRLAQQKIKMLFAMVLQKYTFKTCDKTQIPVELDNQRPSMQPKNGVWLKVAKRD